MTATLLADRPFAALLATSVLDRFASGAMTVLLGFQIYALTHDPLALGMLGLVEAIPGVTLVLYGGHIADRHSRRRIVLLATALTVLVASGFAAVSLGGQHLWLLLLLAFAAASIRAFYDPAMSGLEAQVIPLQHLMPGLAMLATAARLAGVLGPVVGGFAWSVLGPAGTYAAAAAMVATSGLVLWLNVPEQPMPHETAEGQHAGQRIAAGIRYVFRDQILLGSMALDLFAVFFGGATALLPAVATDLLHVGPVGFGLLRSASAAGALVAAAGAARFLPQRRAGHALFWVIGGFGVATVAFGLSRNPALSLAALFVAGLCDGTSVVIRRAILRLASPDAMRGRIAAVKSVFVGSSNELGAFESGVAASLIGTAAAIWSGGVATLLIVAATALLAPRLRRLDLAALAEQDLLQAQTERTSV